MKNVLVKPETNYIAAFLTFSCTLRCTYCINHHGGDLVKKRWMSGKDWVRAINRIHTRPDLPVTIQGGEPTAHKHFYDIVRGIRADIPLDLLTNLEIDVSTFAHHVPPSRFKRDAPYASIRVSYHHGQGQYYELIAKVLFLLNEGYSIGIWEVGHPDYMEDVQKRQSLATSLGIDYRIKEFLGPWKGQVHGTMRYPDAVSADWLRDCECKTSEILLDPQGDVYRCHSDLYAKRCAVGNLLDPGFNQDILHTWMPCSVYGKCNSCDIKIKTNRFQEYGHSSVEIRNVSGEASLNPGKVCQVVNTYGKQ